MWKKEIRVSDFLRRSKKERKAEDVPPVAEPSAEIPLAGAVAAGPESAAPSSGPTSQPDRDADTGAPPTPTDLEAPGQEDASTVGSAPAAGDATGAAAGSVWKKELKLSGLFSRKTQATGQVAGRTETKPPQREQREADRLRTETGPAHRGPSRPNGAAPLPDVPLVRALNLLPREEVKVRSGRPVLPYVGVGLLAALVVGALAVVFLNERSKIDDQQAQKEDLEAQIAALQAVEQTSPQEGIQLAGEALTRASALSTALDGRIVWDRFLRDLSLTLPEGVWFSAVTSTAATAAPDAAPTAPVITIGGYAKSQAGLAQLVSRLGVLPELASVQLQSGTVVTLGAEEVVQFTIIATAKQSTATAAPVSPTEVAAS
jgi:Tfp pilus assembly protein PilN